MRNSPLWRPQPSKDFDESVQNEVRSQPVSVLSVIGLGLAIAVGVGAIGAFAFLGEEGSSPALASAEAPVQTPPPATGLPGVALQDPLPTATGAFSAQPGPAPAASSEEEVIEVAIAESEFDVARLEVMTGMIEPPTPAVGPDDRGVAVAVDAEIRPGTDISVSPEVAPVAEDATETASIASEQIDSPEAATALPERKPAAPALPELHATKVNKYVNLRAGPADEARVIMVVPAGAAVQAQSGCGWCVVTYKGQRGYIYKSFLQSGGAVGAVSSKSAPGLF